MLVSSMMRMLLLLMMALLLVMPRWLSLRVLLLVREDVLWIDHFEGRRVIRQRSGVIMLDVQVISGDEHRQELNIMETLRASEFLGRFEVAIGSFKNPKLMQVLRSVLLFADSSSLVRR